jgi:hypothetical protein
MTDAGTTIRDADLQPGFTLDCRLPNGTWVEGEVVRRRADNRVSVAARGEATWLIVPSTCTTDLAPYVAGCNIALSVLQVA